MGMGKPITPIALESIALDRSRFAEIIDEYLYLLH